MQRAQLSLDDRKLRDAVSRAATRGLHSAVLDAAGAQLTASDTAEHRLSTALASNGTSSLVSALEHAQSLAVVSVDCRKQIALVDATLALRQALATHEPDGIKDALLLAELYSVDSTEIAEARKHQRHRDEAERATTLLTHALAERDALALESALHAARRVDDEPVGALGDLVAQCSSMLQRLNGVEDELTLGIALGAVGEVCRSIGLQSAPV